MTCPHERQEWRSVPLLCATPGCPEGGGRCLVVPYCSPGRPLLREAIFDRVLLTTGLAEVAGRTLRRRSESQSWVWVRRGSVFNPRRR